MVEGVTLQQRRPPLYLLTSAMVVVGAHTPCLGRAVHICCSLRHGIAARLANRRWKTPRNKRHLYSASSCDFWRSKALIKSGHLKIKIGYLKIKIGYLKIKFGYLTPAFLGTRKWAKMLPNPCILGGPQQMGQNFRAPLARPYVWLVAIDPW